LSEKEEENLPNYYHRNEIIGKFNYYYDKYAEKFIVEDNNHFIIIHGHHLYVSLNGNNRQGTELCNFLLNLYIKNYNQFLEELDFIGGRYVVIVGNKNKLEIFPD